MGLVGIFMLNEVDINKRFCYFFFIYKFREFLLGVEVFIGLGLWELFFRWDKI